MGHSEQQLTAFAQWERAAWEQRAAPYAASVGELTSGSISALLDAAAVGHGTRLLDVGTGPGFVALAAAARGAVVRAADQSAAMVQLARAAGVDAVQAGVQRLPFDVGSFEAVVAGYLLNHLARPEAAVAELARVLAPGGRLAMTVWDTPADNPAIGLIGTVIIELGLTGTVPPGPDAHRFASDTELRALLGDWQDVAIERLHWSVSVAPGAWFDAIADATARTGAALAQAGPDRRAQARNRYIELATQLYGSADGLIALPAGAVLVSATNRAAT